MIRAALCALVLVTLAYAGQVMSCCDQKPTVVDGMIGVDRVIPVSSHHCLSGVEEVIRQVAAIRTDADHRHLNVIKNLAGERKQLPQGTFVSKFKRLARKGYCAFLDVGWGGSNGSVNSLCNVLFVDLNGANDVCLDSQPGVERWALADVVDDNLGRCGLPTEVEFANAAHFNFQPGPIVSNVRSFGSVRRLHGSLSSPSSFFGSPGIEVEGAGHEEYAADSDKGLNKAYGRHPEPNPRHHLLGLQVFLAALSFAIGSYMLAYADEARDRLKRPAFRVYLAVSYCLFLLGIPGAVAGLYIAVAG